jgi:hypothetical protein
MDNPDDANVFHKKQFLYGVDGRCNVGFGFWQFAFASKQALDVAHFAAAFAAIEGMKGDYGRALGIKPTHLVVPPSLARSRAAVDQQRVRRRRRFQPLGRQRQARGGPVARVVGGIAALLASAAFFQVRARSGTFRRAGRAFGPEYTIIETDDLNFEEGLALVNEPELEVGASKDGEEYFPVEPIDPPEHPTLAETEGPGPSDQVEELNRTIDELEKDLQGVRDELATATSTISSLQSSLTAANQASDELRGKLTAAEERVAEIEALKLENVTAEGSDEVELVPPAPAGAMTTPAAPVSSAGKKKAGDKS